MILAIDTSSAEGSLIVGEPAAALGQKPTIYFEAQFQTGRAHGGDFFSALENAKSYWANAKLETIVVGLGPGSYSGIRLSIAAAIGLAKAANANLVGRPSATAFPLPSGQESYHAIGDARKGQYYYSLVVKRRCEYGPLLLDETALREQLKQCPSLPLFTFEKLELFPEAQLTYPQAACLLELPIAQKEHVASLEPIYLRPPAITAPKQK